MYISGTVEGYTYSAKVFDKASSMGINEGRISKLTIKKDSKIICHYDRGWDVKPSTAEDKKATKKAIAQAIQAAMAS